MPDHNGEKQLALMHTLVDLSKERSQMSAERSYMNAERTLSVWIRTALAAMIFGLAIDRFGLMLHELPLATQSDLSKPDALTHYTGLVLVVYSMIIAFFCAVRFGRYCRQYRKEFKFPDYHHAWLPLFFAYMILLFGAGLMALMIWIP